MREQNDKTNRYFGITIGPITRVISYAKATRGIWAASYFFSWLGQEIVEKLIDPNYDYKHDMEDFVKPTITKEDIDSVDMVGRFPDQYIFSAKEGETLTYVRGQINAAIEKRAGQMAKALKEDAVQVKNYLMNVLRITAFETSLSGAQKDVVEKMQSYMGVLDCRDSFQTEVKFSDDYLPRLFEKDLSDLRNLYFDKETIEKISNEEKKKTALNTLKTGFANMERLGEKKPYVAFVVADGDNFGLNNDMISEQLSEFNKALPPIISSIGGQVIYQGGDDITFYMPLSFKEKINDVFAVIQKIDEKFKTIVLDKVKNKNWTNNKAPSISYGVAISYSKYPMAETRQKANDLLEYKAKELEDKNAICWQLRKHSGQTSEGIIRKKNRELFQHTCTLISDALKGTKEKTEDVNFLHSLTHGIMSYKALLHNILSDNNENRQTLLNNFFKNVYDDNYKQFENQLETAQKILLDGSFELDAKKKEDYPANAVEYLHNLLRYIELLIRKEDRI